MNMWTNEIKIADARQRSSSELLVLTPPTTKTKDHLSFRRRTEPIVSPSSTANISKNQQSSRNKRCTKFETFNQQLHSNSSYKATARCGEIFVARNARQWTFVCTFCDKSTRDIGEFICHIRIKHLQDSSDDTDDDGNISEDGYAYGQVADKDYLDCSSYLDMSVDTEPDEPRHNGQQHHYSEKKLKDTIPIIPTLPTIPKDMLTQLACNKQQVKIDVPVPIVVIKQEKNDDYDCQVDAEHISDIDSRNGENYQAPTAAAAKAVSSSSPSSCNTKITANGAVNTQTTKYNEETPYDCNASDNDEDGQLDNEDNDDDGDEDNNVDGFEENAEDADFDNQLLLAPGGGDSLDATSASGSDAKIKRRQIRGPAYCSICKRTFQYYSLYRNHMIKHSNETPFKCVQCKKGFKSKQAIRYHMNTHQREKQYKCTICAAAYCTENQFIAHVLKHANATTFPCVVCGQILKSKLERDKHLSDHTGERPFRCAFCQKLFRLRHHLSNHLKMHLQYRCDYCKENFVSSVNLRKPYTCVRCRLSTSERAVVNLDNSANNNDADVAPFANVVPVRFFEPPPLPTRSNISLQFDAEMESDSDADPHESENDERNDEEADEDNINDTNTLLSYATPSGGGGVPQQSVSGKRFVCTYCQRSYSHLSGLNYHIKHKHC